MVGWLALAGLVGCSVANDIDGFGALSTALLVPCSTGEPDAEMVVAGVFTRRRRGCVEWNTLFDHPPEFGCDFWVPDDTVVPICPSGLTASWTSMMTFHLDEGIDDVTDLEGARADRVSVTSCRAVDDSDAVDDVFAAQIEVIADDGPTALVQLDDAPVSGLVEAEVCR